MKKISIGTTDLQVAPFNLGGNVFGWTLNEQQSFHLLDAYAEAGFDFIDTADSYSYWVDGGSGGQSETILGKWMKDRRNRHNITIATKVGGRTGLSQINSSREHILQAVDKSLKRLQTDYIDLYYLHYDDGLTPVEETMSAFDELVRAGKVRAVAASNISHERLQASLAFSEREAIAKYQALQPHYNLVERATFEQEYQPVAAAHHLTVFPYYALASGFLTGKYRSEDDVAKSPRGAAAAKYLTEKGLSVLSGLDQLSEKYASTPAALALAWLLHKPTIGAPIASATSIPQLKELLQATQIQFEQADLELLDQVSAG